MIISILALWIVLFVCVFIILRLRRDKIASNRCILEVLHKIGPATNYGMRGEKELAECILDIIHEYATNQVKQDRSCIMK